MKASDYQDAIDNWHTQRLSNLAKPDGFLTLVGLPWLKAGMNSIGSDTSNDAIFPSGLPETIGTIDVRENEIVLSIEEGVEAIIENTAVTQTPILTDADPNGPTIIHMGSVNWFLIKRGDALGIRIRDSQSKRRLQFQGVERFPIVQSWRIEGRFEPYDEPRVVQIPTILGTPEDRISPGTIHAEIQGKAISLTALKSQYPNQFFLVIADDTTGKESYGGGRFLMSEPLKENGRVVIDFNKAYNPPCAFSPYATCPRPPQENKIPIAIPAGEKKFVDPFHD